ncbi:MAG: hypothetical protein ACKVTZ_19765 [Bacteroidia bacterium]
MEKWTFKNCTLVQLEKKFGLLLEDTLPALNDLLDISSFPITEQEQVSLFPFQSFLQEKVDDWNEQELSLHFIGPIFSLVRFSSKKYGSFAGRDLMGTVGDIEFSGKPDEMIASGRLEPEIPYFFLQEYKQETDPNGDPRAQVLAAMLVAQTKNEDGLPIYGGYVRGRNWFFMTLEGKKYAKSRAYDATQEDIFDIFKILKKLKTIIEARLPKD